MKRWKISSPIEQYRAKIYRCLKAIVTMPNGESTDFDLLQCADWVNIVALNTSGEFILVSQYRAGTDSITLETAAGAVERNEPPIDAAKRELSEETGYTSSSWISLGHVDVNPAFMMNKCHIFLALDCIKTDDTNFDDFEDIEIIHLSEVMLKKKLESEITHSLSLLSFLKYFSWQQVL